MNFKGIALYSGRALAFAALVCLLYGAYCLLRKKKLRFGHLLAVGYLAALIQITVLRGGVDWPKVLEGVRTMPQLVPLKTTVGEVKAGLWPLVYHTAGNMGWFVPLGMLLRRKRPLRVLIIGAALSAGIEIMQFLLMTGMTDIDDVILNALGALAGWILIRCIKKKNGFE